MDRVDFIGLFHFWGIGSTYENRSDSDWIVVAVSIGLYALIQGGMVMFRRLEYWKTVRSESKPWVEYVIVPRQIREESSFLDDEISIVKSLGLSYQVIEITEVLKESRECE